MAFLLEAILNSYSVTAAKWVWRRDCLYLAISTVNHAYQAAATHIAGPCLSSQSRKALEGRGLEGRRHEVRVRIGNSLGPLQHAFCVERSGFKFGRRGSQYRRDRLPGIDVHHVHENANLGDNKQARYNLLADRYWKS